MSNPFHSAAATMALRSGISALKNALKEATVSGNTPNFRELMRAWYLAADAYLEIVTADRVFSCHSGCSACCFDNPQGVLAAEMALIEDKLELSMLGGLREDVLAFGGISKRFTDPEQRGVAFKRLERPCPMLDNNGSCKIYADRPMACRGFFAETLSTWCHPANEQTKAARLLSIEWPIVVTDLLIEISRWINPKKPQDSLRSAMLSRIEHQIN